MLTSPSLPPTDTVAVSSPLPLLPPVSSSGLVQVLTDALSLDAIKKTPGYTNLPQVHTHLYT